MRLFGARAVYGDEQLSLEKMRELLLLRNLENAWDSRESSKDWAEWAEHNPDANELLDWAMMRYEHGQRS